MSETVQIRGQVNIERKAVAVYETSCEAKALSFRSMRTPAAWPEAEPKGQLCIQTKGIRARSSRIRRDGHATCPCGGYESIDVWRLEPRKVRRER
jgi:hypothetical protein